MNMSVHRKMMEDTRRPLFRFSAQISPPWILVYLGGKEFIYIVEASKLQRHRERLAQPPTVGSDGSVAPSGITYNLPLPYHTRV